MSLSPSTTSPQRKRGQTGLRPRRNLFSSVGGVITILLFLELATRTYALYQGRGFAEDPRAFTTPFSTSEDWPPPYKTGDVYEFKDGDHLTAEEAHRSVVVVCFGGSTTLSRNAEGKAYPRVLEDLLQRTLHTSAVRVMNAGGNGFSSAHALMNFSLQILTPDIKPDIIVVDHNINDLTANYFGAETMPDYSNKYMTDYYLAYPHKSGPASLLLRQSRFFRFLYYRRGVAGSGFDRAPDTDFRAGLGVFERNLRSMAALARANGIDVVFATQPAGSLGIRTLESHRLYNETNQKVAAEFGSALADVAGAVSDERDFIDDVHFSPSGVDKAAKAFYPPVRRLVEARLPSVNAVASVTRP